MRNLSEYTHCNQTRVVDFVGRTQRLRSDFASVCRLLNISDDACVDLDSLSRHCLNSCSKASKAVDDTSAVEYAAAHANRLRLIDAYDDVTRDLVANAWAEDIALFNLSWAEAVAADD